tara:strand:- start:52 stop:348 length:297 start_codon:yes stop_codon:yes gene_type:complete
MGMSSDKDKQIARSESEAKRQKAKSGKPEDNYGEKYVTGLEGYRAQGKGTKVRDTSGWFSEETTEKLNKIFKRKQKEYKDNRDMTPIPEFDNGKKETK